MPAEISGHFIFITVGPKRWFCQRAQASDPHC